MGYPKRIANWKSRHPIIPDLETEGTYINLRKYGKGG